jgi:hypothetical protein
VVRRTLSAIRLALRGFCGWQLNALIWCPRTLIEPVMFAAAIGTAPHGAHRCDGTPVAVMGRRINVATGISGYVG